MAAAGNAIQCVTDDALFVDDEGGANHALAHDAIHFLVLQYAICRTGGLLLVGQQPHADAVLVAKLAMLDAIVARNAEYGGTQFGERVFQFGKLDRFGRAARCIVAHIEIQHQRLAPELGQLDDVHVRVGVGKVRRPISCFQHGLLRLSVFPAAF